MSANRNRHSYSLDCTLHTHGEERRTPKFWQSLTKHYDTCVDHETGPGSPGQARHSKRSLSLLWPISLQQLEASTFTLNAQHTRNVDKNSRVTEDELFLSSGLGGSLFFDDLGGDVKLRVDLYFLRRLIKGLDRGLHELHIKDLGERSSGLFYCP